MSELPLESLIRSALFTISRSPSSQDCAQAIQSFQEGELESFIRLGQESAAGSDSSKSSISEQVRAMREALEAAVKLVAQCNAHINERLAQEQQLNELIFGLCTNAIDLREAQEHLLSLRVTERARTVDILSMLMDSLNGRLNKSTVTDRVQAHTDRLKADDQSLQTLKQERQASSLIRRIMRDSRNSQSAAALQSAEALVSQSSSFPRAGGQTPPAS